MLDPKLRLRIVTLTLNPAVDIACRATFVRPTHKIRTSGEQFDPGGGGINVARVMHTLGTDALALIMTGGITGQLVQQLLDREGVRWQRLPTRGFTRISLNVHDCRAKLEYRFVADGPQVAENEWRQALDILHTGEADWVVASGSLPPGVPYDFDARAAAVATRRGQKFALDTSGPALRAAVGHGVAVLKLSLGELEFLAGFDLRDRDQQEAAILALHRHGAADVIAVSLGREGALLASKTGVGSLQAPPVNEQSAVGAGDSFLAGLVFGLARGMPERTALALGNAAGAAAVTACGTARVQRDKVGALFGQLCSTL